MDSLLSKGDRLSYYTYEGIKSSVIVNAVIVNNKTFYQLENGEFAIETKLGATRAMLNEDLLKALNIASNDKPDDSCQ